MVEMNTTIVTNHDAWTAKGEQIIQQRTKALAENRIVASMKAYPVALPCQQSGGAHESRFGSLSRPCSPTHLPVLSAFDSGRVDISVRQNKLVAMKPLYS